MFVYACGIDLNREDSQDTKTKEAAMKRLMYTQMTSDPHWEMWRHNYSYTTLFSG